MGGCNMEERMVSGLVMHYPTNDSELVFVLPTVSLVLGNTICCVDNSLTDSACSLPNKVLQIFEDVTIISESQHIQTVRCFFPPRRLYIAILNDRLG